MIERLPVTILFILIGLTCLVISKRPALSQREQKQLKELDDIISKMYGGN